MNSSQPSEPPFWFMCLPEKGVDGYFLRPVWQREKTGVRYRVWSSFFSQEPHGIKSGDLSAAQILELTDWYVDLSSAASRCNAAGSLIELDGDAAEWAKRKVEKDMWELMEKTCIGLMEACMHPMLGAALARGFNGEALKEFHGRCVAAHDTDEPTSPIEFVVAEGVWSALRQSLRQECLGVEHNHLATLPTAADLPVGNINWTRAEYPVRVAKLLGVDKRTLMADSTIIRKQVKPPNGRKYLFDFEAIESRNPEAAEKLRADCAS